MLPILTSILTAIFAVIVFVIGQMVQRFIFEPIQEQRKVSGEIAFALLYYANVRDMNERANQNLVKLDGADDVAKHLRTLAGKLRTTLYVIPYYNTLARLKFIPNEDAVKEASQSLIGWSNSIHSGDPETHKETIAACLKLNK